MQVGTGSTRCASTAGAQDELGRPRPHAPAALDRGATNYVAGHRCLTGSAIRRRAEAAGFENIVGKTSNELDLRDSAAVFAYISEKDYDGADHVNIGAGTDTTIREIADTVDSVIDYEGETHWDATKPDGTPRILLHASKLAGVWMARISLREGLEHTVAWYRQNADTERT